MENWFTDLIFQAEDGIRELVRSRGLGDVYKRQLLVGVDDTDPVGIGVAGGYIEVGPLARPGTDVAVSYTHLTLPTIYSV